MRLISNYCVAAIFVATATAASALSAYADSPAFSRISSADFARGGMADQKTQWFSLGNQTLQPLRSPKQDDRLGMMKICPQTRANIGDEVYFENFDEVETFSDFTIIDANEDGITWQCEEGDGFSCIRYNRDLQMDDWMITPAIELEAGVTYQVEFMSSCSGRTVPERIEVFAGTGTTVGDMNVPVVKPTTIVSEIVKGVFTADVSGDWHIGFHGISDPDMGFLGVWSITVTVAPPLRLPDIRTILRLSLTMTALLRVRSK